MKKENEEIMEETHHEFKTPYDDIRLPDIAIGEKQLPNFDADWTEVIRFTKRRDFIKKLWLTAYCIVVVVLLVAVSVMAQDNSKLSDRLDTTREELVLAEERVSSLETDKTQAEASVTYWKDKTVQCQNTVLAFVAYIPHILTMSTSDPTFISLKNNINICTGG